jgi:hypothetical protein
LRTGIQPTTLNKGRYPHVISFGAVSRICGIRAGCGFAHGSQTWPSEDPPAREVHREEPTQLNERLGRDRGDKKPEKAAVSDDLGKTRFVHDVMAKQAYYCREDQSMDEALRIMRKHGLQYLPVVDNNLRIVGVVRRNY